ncbi:helix-turn-helix transcriptional regulator [Bacillus xiapuensis]|uniref:helix-turn-helix transcriptional regulator n=1 Tax=Bacillus xiapuensis TaxID=2014075 RepID=UPI000C246582|nr:LuxR C-terminal-related transcriptional regulator [Bacillus xiapuensis]
MPEKMTALPRTDQLTPTEKNALNQSALKKTNKEIGRGLAMSHCTVKFHIATIKRKLVY